MTRQTRSAGKLLNQFFERVPKPSAEQLARSRRNILAVLDVTVDASTTTPARKRTSRFALPAAAAAVVIILVGMAVILRDEAPINHGLERSEAPALIPAGQTIEPGERIHSKNGGVFRLADSSRVEMRPDSDLSLERAKDGVRIHLSRGGIVVYATEQRTGHLYVQTRDLTVSVVGTVFLVNAEEQGSRVAVIAGEVLVRQGARIQRLLPGEQVITNSEMSSVAPTGLALLQQSAALVGAAGELFEEASIRPSAPLPGGRGNANRFDYPPVLCYSPQSVQINPGRFIATGTNLTGLIAAAYGNRCPLPEVLSGGPDWVREEIYDVQALIPVGSPAYTNSDFLAGNAPKLQKMLQNLLTARFKLKLGREVKEVPAYNLVLVKEGKLRLSEDQTGVTKAPMPRGVPGGTSYSGGNSLTMAEFVRFLEYALGRTVVNKTEVKGLHDFGVSLPQMSYSNNGGRDVSDMQRQLQSGRRDVLPQALEEQFGLKLEPTMVLTEFLTIEHAEKPSEN
jgi:uncharacterized protein (TIGR03435 family)